MRPYKNIRRNRGHSIIELACVAMLLAVVALLGADIGIVVLADSTNERACRDAARAAAAASDATSALSMAQAAVIAHKSGSGFLTSPTVDVASFQYQDFSGSPPPNTSPYVEVTTQITVKLPAPVLFMGATLNPNNGQMSFRKTYNFPIIKTKLYLQ